MKRVIYTFVLFLFANVVIAQTPQKFNYQAVARNVQGAVLPTQNVTIRASILNGSANGTNQYSETHSVTTSQLGLFNLSIGGGLVVSGSFANITWSSGDKFLKIEMDASGGNNFTLVGTSQLLSVPYALNAKKVEVESQTLSISGNTLSITQGNSVVLPSSGGNSLGMWKQELPMLEYNNPVTLNNICSDQDGSRVYVTYYSGNGNPGTMISVFKKDNTTGQYYIYKQKQLSSGYSKSVLIGGSIYFISSASQSIVKIDTAAIISGAAVNPSIMNFVGSSFNGTANLITDGNDLLVYNTLSSSWVRHTISGNSLVNAGVVMGNIPFNSKYIYDGNKMFTYSESGIIQKWTNANTLDITYERMINNDINNCHLVNGGSNFMYIAYQPTGTAFVSLLPIAKVP